VDYSSEMLSRYRNKGLLVDTGLLLLLLVGALDRDRIERFKRTNAFTAGDYDLLLKIVALFKKVATTPNILTEVSDLLAQLPEEILPAYYKVFTHAVNASEMEEEYTPSRGLAAQSYFTKLGLTDSSIIGTCKGKYLVLTVDLPLFHYLRNSDIDAINFNHLRSLAWFADSLS
jgi:hypothetical protein